MITKVIFRLRHLAGCTFGELLGRQSLTSDWCRELLPQAEELLRQVKSLQAQDRLSRRTSACESFLLEITVRDAESLVRSLSNLMHRPNIHLCRSARFSHASRQTRAGSGPSRS